MSCQEGSDHVTERENITASRQNSSLPRGVPAQAEQAGQSLTWAEVGSLVELRRVLHVENVLARGAGRGGQQGGGGG